jgi:hypothetical protein
VELLKYQMAVVKSKVELLKCQVAFVKSEVASDS